MQRQYRKIDISPDTLLGCRFFDRLERAERAHIARYCEGRCYRSNVEIIEYGDNTRDVFFVLTGKVQTSLFTSTGRTFYFQELTQGEMFGELAALDGGPRSTSVLTVGETQVVRISGENFKDIVARFPTLAEQTMLRLCSLSRFLLEHAITFHAFTVPEQIRMEVCRIVQQYPVVDGGAIIDPAPTHEEIARRVGTTREQVTRVMGEFTKDGPIRLVKKTWHVADVPAVLSKAPTV